MLVDSLDAAENPLEGALHLGGCLGKDGQRAEGDLAAHGQQRDVEEGAGGSQRGQRAPAEPCQITPHQELTSLLIVVSSSPLVAIDKVVAGGEELHLLGILVGGHQGGQVGHDAAHR